LLQISSLREARLIKLISEKTVENLPQTLKDIQFLVNNGVDLHERTKKGKIKVDFKLNGGDFEIVLQDDGQGIDPERIKEKAIEKGLKSEEELFQIKEENIVDMIFMPGLSTKEEMTEVSGRGVGMDAVREEVERLGGTISVSSKIDEGTTLVIKLPILS